MGRYAFHLPFVGALAASAACASPASAQCRLCDTPTTALSSSANDDGIALQVETRLDFDRLVLVGQGQGAAVIRPDGSNSAEGSLASISPRSMVGSASIHGAPNRIVRIQLPERIDLYSLTGARLTLDAVSSDLPSLARLDSAGNLNFRFGGRIRINGDTDGEYRGDLPITVEYQ